METEGLLAYTNLDAAAELIAKRLSEGGTLYAFGNGGSIADASHLVAELIGKFKEPRAPLRAISLTDPAVMTCIANDFGYDQVFSRQLYALTSPLDIAIGFTTSGKSTNILNGLTIAKANGALCICFTSATADYIPSCDLIIRTSGSETRRVQEEHQVMIHDLVENIEQQLRQGKHTVHERGITLFIDLDGTLVKHQQSPWTDNDHLLPGTIETLLKWKRAGYTLILTTGRSSSACDPILDEMSEAGICFNGIITSLPSGPRVIINDSKIPGVPSAKAVCLQRNKGIEDVDI